MPGMDAGAFPPFIFLIEEFQMSLAEKRVRTRDERLNLEDVYGVDPFSSVRNLNQPIEEVTKTLHEVRMSLGKKASDAKNLVKGLRGMFDATTLKTSLMDKLGINLFKRNIGDLKSELNEWADLLGVKTRGSIDKLNSSSSHVLGNYETDFYAYFKDQLPSTSNTSDKLNAGVSENSTPAIPGTTSAEPVAQQTPTPEAVSSTGAKCGMPSIKPSSTATASLGIPSTDIVQSVAVIYPTAITTTAATTTPATFDKVDPVQAFVAIALVALASNEYDSLNNLPSGMKPIIAELLVAIGLDLQHEAAILARVS